MRGGLSGLTARAIRSLMATLEGTHLTCMSWTMRYYNDVLIGLVGDRLAGTVEVKITADSVHVDRDGYPTLLVQAGRRDVLRAILDGVPAGDDYGDVVFDGASLIVYADGEQVVIPFGGELQFALLSWARAVRGRRTPRWPRQWGQRQRTFSL